MLAVLGGMLVLLCLGGIGLGFVLYNEETKPDRSAPDVAVDNYLRALLVDRNDASASVYSCSDQSTLRAITSLRDDIVRREEMHSISIRVSWGRLDVDQRSDEAQVVTNIGRTVVGGGERDIQTWRFNVVDDGGWRVCGAERVS